MQNAPQCMNDSGTCTPTRTKSVPSRSGFDLPTIRRLLAMKEGHPAIAVLRRQLFNYERGDAGSRAALKPMILASVDNLSRRQ